MAGSANLYALRGPLLGRAACLVVLLAFGAVPSRALPERCTPFAGPPAGDTIIQVGPAEVDDLPDITRTAASHTTILLEDGIYETNAYLQFGNPYVTLRSASGNRDAVVLDGGYRSSAAEIVFINEQHITIADLTIKRAWYHPIHITGGGHYATLYNLKIEDGRQQFVKVNQSGGEHADFGLAACNELELTDPGRAFVHDNPTGSFLCYTGGFDLHQTWGWVIRDSVIRNIHCTNGGLAEHAIHFFHSNREPLVERNLILHNARGIGFGLGQDGFARTFADDPFEDTEMEGRDDEVMHIGGTIQNNMIYADIDLWYDSGIGLESAWRPIVRHNTIYSAQGGFNSAIDIRFSGSESVELANNLYYPVITQRNDAPDPEVHANALASPELFADLEAGDMHLVDSALVAIDQGWNASIEDDYDGETRDLAPDIGADEYFDPNLAPVVTIHDPLDQSSYGDGTVIDFSGSALDPEEGDLSADLHWTSDLDGALGTGATLATSLSVGLHTIEARAADSASSEGADSITIGVTREGCPNQVVFSDETVTDVTLIAAIFEVIVSSNVQVGAFGGLTLRAGDRIRFDNGLSVLVDGALEATPSATPCD